MKFTITLREEIWTGIGWVKTLDVINYSVNQQIQMVQYQVENGYGDIPLKNISGIIPIQKITDGK